MYEVKKYNGPRIKTLGNININTRVFDFVFSVLEHSSKKHVFNHTYKELLPFFTSLVNAT